EGHQVAAVHQAPAESEADALLGPGMQLAGKGIVEGEQQLAALAAQERAAALRAFGERQQVERRRRGAQLRHRQRLQAQGAGEARGKAVRVERDPFLEHVDDPAARCARGVPRLRDFFGADGHRTLPASSKMGMYMRITMAPITRPMSAIRSGSNRRVNQSTQRASSSSWKAAICSSISPMFPPFSPTASMRSATGVVSPFASIDWDTLRPSLMALLATTRRSRSSGCSSSAPISSAATSGMPPRSSMPMVR